MAAITFLPTSESPLPAVYWRRRLVVALALALAAMCMALLLQVVAGDPPTERLTATVPGALPPVAAPVPAPEIVVQPGDTLWSIARRLQPAGDVRPLVDALAEANGGSALEVGERLRVPVRGP